jgi:hypothetical protein
MCGGDFRVNFNNFIKSWPVQAKKALARGEEEKRYEALGPTSA